MRRLIVSSFAALALCSAALADELAREDRHVSGVDQVMLRRAGELIVTQSDREALVIEAEKELLPKITTEVKAGVLHFDFSESQISTAHPIRFFLTVKSLSRIGAGGGGSVKAHNLSGDSLELAMTGGARASFDSVVVNRLSAKLAGAASVRIGGGAARDQQVSIEGAGRYDSSGLEGVTAAATISGAGRASVTVSERLTAQVSGAGSIAYSGNPKVEAKVTGPGRVQRRS